MPALTELKKALVAEGFEIYRTLSDRVVLAERVRDNLIMDSGVAAGLETSMAVHFTVRAQANDFPAESEEELFERARALASDALGRGYSEAGASVVKIPDPGNRSRILDTWYEVSYRRGVSDHAELVSELKYALQLTKTAQWNRA